MQSPLCLGRAFSDNHNMRRAQKLGVSRYKTVLVSGPKGLMDVSAKRY